MSVRPNWSRPLPRPLTIPTVMDLVTLHDKLLGHLPKEARAKSTWQHVEAKLREAAAGGSADDVSIALQMAFQLERIEYQ